MQLAGSLAQQLMESMCSLLSWWREIMCVTTVACHPATVCKQLSWKILMLLIVWQMYCKASLTCTGLVPQHSPMVQQSDGGVRRRCTA